MVEEECGSLVDLVVEIGVVHFLGIISFPLTRLGRHYQTLDKGLIRCSRTAA